MSIEVIGGGGGYAEYKSFQITTTVNAQSTEFTTDSYDNEKYPQLILQIAISGIRYTDSSVTTLFDYRFPFYDNTTSNSINGTYGDGSFATATIKEITTTVSGVVKHSFNVSNMKAPNGNVIYFYPSNSNSAYVYRLRFYGYNS